MADNLNSISLPENRPALEALIEAAITGLDALDGDPDLKIECEYEGVNDDGPEFGSPWCSPLVTLGRSNKAVRS